MLPPRVINYLNIKPSTSLEKSPVELFVKHIKETSTIVETLAVTLGFLRGCRQGPIAENTIWFGCWIQDLSITCHESLFSVE